VIVESLSRLKTKDSIIFLRLQEQKTCNHNKEEAVVLENLGNEANVKDSERSKKKNEKGTGNHTSVLSTCNTDVRDMNEEMASYLSLSNSRDNSDHIDKQIISITSDIRKFYTCEKLRAHFWMKMQRIDKMVLYQGDDTVFNLVTIPVHPVMLDILTERHYEKYGEDAI